MADNRPRITPTKVVNLVQLDGELGGVGLARNDETGEIVAPESVTQKQFEDAVAAHTASFPPDPEDEFDADLAAAAAKPTLEEKVDALFAALQGANGGPGAEPRRGPA